MTRILTSGRLGEPVAEALRERGLEARAAEHPTDADLAWADCYAAFRWPEGATQPVGWIHCTGLGTDGFDAAPPPGRFTRTVGAMPERMGRYVLTAVLSHAQHADEYAAAQRDHAWTPLPDDGLPGRALVLGTGPAASGVARALRSVGIEVTGVNTTGHAASAFDRTLTLSALSTADAPWPIVVDVLPDTPRTRGLVDDAFLGLCRDNLFVNTGRGVTVATDALRAALEDGRVARAWLDVFPTEPLPADSWLWDHPRVRITPHVAAITSVDDVVTDLLAALP